MSIWGGVAAAVAPTVIGSLLGGGKKKTYEQVPMETPEQAAARRKLMGFANTGKFGNFTAGEEVPLGYGDFNPTGIEQTGLTSLQNLLQTSIPDKYKLSDAAINDMLATSPGAIEAQFQPFKDQVSRATAESERNLKRSAAFGGNLYSTDTVRGLGDIQARSNETMMSKLADLTNEALNRRLQAAGLSMQSAQQQENTALQRVQASQTMGSLTRNLNNQAIQARDAELLRRRAELQLPIQAAQTVAGQSTNFGVPSVTTSQTSPYQNVLDIAGQIGGQYLGNELFKYQFGGAPKAYNPTGYLSPYSKLSL